MRRPWSLSAKLGAIGSALLLVALGAIGLTLWISVQLEGGAAAVNEAGRMRMLVWRAAHAIDRGDQPQLNKLSAEVDQRLETLQHGDPARPLFVPQDAGTQAAFEQLRHGWQRLKSLQAATSLPGPGAHTLQAQQLVDQVDHFVSAIERQLAALGSVLNASQLALLALAVGIALSWMAAARHFVFQPLKRLKGELARLAQGDLSARVEAGAKDEFGALAQGFNEMAHQLQGLYHNLEARVQEQTQSLAQEHARLGVLYQAAGFAARSTTLDELARGFARQMREVARADASAVRWSDESNQRYLMLASDCLPQQMIDAEHCVPTGDCHCGQAQEHARLRVIPIVEQGARRNHCEQAGFATLISVPLRLQERMVGEVDLFYRSSTALDSEDRSLLEALAGHLAAAIEGLRAGALQREAAAADERGLLARELHDSIAQGLAFLKIQTSLLRSAVQAGNGPRVAYTLDELDEGVRESLADVRELLLHFRTRTDAEDVEHALKTTLKKFEHQTGLSTKLAMKGDGMPLAPDVQVQVLHVVQEALSNVRKHARASQVWVDVQQAPQWRVEVRDNGCGFEIDDQPLAETHVGLRIMRERAQRIGAQVLVDSLPGGGTRVQLTLPTPEALAA